jgi:hypothetical protein
MAVGIRTGEVEGSSIWGRDGKRRSGGRRKGKGIQGTKGKQVEEKIKIFIFSFLLFFSAYSQQLYISLALFSLLSLSPSLSLFSPLSPTPSRSPSLPPVSFLLSFSFFIFSFTFHSLSLALFLSPSLAILSYPSSLSLSLPSLPFSKLLGERVSSHSRHKRELTSERQS